MTGADSTSGPAWHATSPKKVLRKTTNPMDFLVPTQIKLINFCMTYLSYQSNLYSDIQDETAYNRQLK